MTRADCIKITETLLKSRPSSKNYKLYIELPTAWDQWHKTRDLLAEMIHESRAMSRDAFVSLVEKLSEESTSICREIV